MGHENTKDKITWDMRTPRNTITEGMRTPRDKITITCEHQGTE